MKNGFCAFILFPFCDMMEIQTLKGLRKLLLSVFLICAVVKTNDAQELKISSIGEEVGSRFCLDIDVDTINNPVNLYRDTITFKFKNANNVFNKYIAFTEVDFKGEAFFHNASFNESVFFSFVNIERELSLLVCNFKKEISIYNSTFDRRADFSNSVFSGNIFLRGVQINDELSFRNVIFRRNLELRYLNFDESGKVSFQDCILPDTLDLSYNYKIPATFDLTAAKFEISDLDSAFNKNNLSLITKLKDRICKIFLYKTDLSKIQLDYFHFKLIFNYPKSTKEISADEKQSIYEGVLKNFKDRGQQESFKLLDIEYQKFKWSKKSAIFRWLVIFPEYWWNFGYDRDRIFLWAGILICIFTLINFPFVYSLNKKVYAIENVPTSPVGRSTFRKAFSQLWYSFVYTSTIFFRLTLKVEKLQYKNVVGTLYVFLIYLLGIICLAYMANFVLQH